MPSLKKSAILCAAILLPCLMMASCGEPRIVPNYAKAHRIADGCSVVIWVTDDGVKVVKHQVWLEPDQWLIVHGSAIK